LSSGIVQPDSLEGEVLLLIVQELGSSRMGRKNEHGRDSEEQSNDTRHKEDPLVGFQAGSFDLSETVREERS
jgi:hypothetical protein